jgi:HrpA-like RNA helicase
MDPPQADAVRSAVERLTDVGAVEATAEQRAAKRCGKLTELGRVCSELPLDTHLTRLVLLGRGFGVLVRRVSFL